MKRLVILEKEFLLDPDVFQFLNAYLARISDFVRRHQIDVDLHQDILQLVIEKLNAYADTQYLTQKQAIQIVSELGEPEEIFSDEIVVKQGEKSDSGVQELAFYEKMQKSGRSRPQKSAFFLGVYKMFADKLGFNVWILRGIVVLAFLVGLFALLGISFGTYFLLALICPRAEKDYKKRSVLNYFLTQVWDLRLLFANSFRQMRSVISRGAPKSATLVGKCFWGAISIVRFCFFFSWCSGMLLTTMFGLGLLYILLSPLVINQMDLHSFFPALFPWATGFGILAAVGFFARGLATWMRRKISIWILISSCVFACLTFVGAGIVGAKLFSVFQAPSQTLTRELTIKVPAHKAPFLINVEPLQWDTELEGTPLELIGESRFYNLIPSDEEEIKVVYTFKVLAGSDEKNKQKLNLLSENLSTPVYHWDKDLLTIGLSGNQLFDQITPYLPMGYSVDLYIPKDLQFKFTVGEGRSRYSSSVHKPEWAEKYGGNTPCNQGIISYKSAFNAFFCEIAMTQEMKRRLISIQLQDRGDEIALFTGENWDFSFMDKENGQYWRVHSMRPLSAEEFVVKLSDQFFNLFMKVKVDLDKEGNLIIEQVELEDLEQKGLMNEERLASYPGLGLLSGVKLKMQDKEQELVSQIQALEKRLEVLQGDEE